MNIEKITRLSNVQKKIDNFSQKYFLKNNNETNKQEPIKTIFQITSLVDVFK